MFQLFGPNLIHLFPNALLQKRRNLIGKGENISSLFCTQFIHNLFTEILKVQFFDRITECLNIIVTTSFRDGRRWCYMENITGKIYLDKVTIIAHMTLLNQVSRKDKKKEEDLLTIMITKMMIFLVSFQNILGIQKCMEWQNLNRKNNKHTISTPIVA